MIRARVQSGSVRALFMEGAHGDAEAFGAAVHGFADGEDLFGELDGQLQADGFEHLFAGAEVVVDGAVGDAGFFGQGVEGQVAHAGAGVDAQGGVEPLCRLHGPQRRAWLGPRAIRGTGEHVLA